MAPRWKWRSGSPNFDRSRSPTAPTVDRVIPSPRLVRTAAGTLAVREWPSDGRTPLVFWHALGPCASGAELVELAPRLAAHGIAPVSVDGPGFGASPPATAYDLESLANLLRATIRELQLDRPVLMGHSWGGGVATTLAALHPDETGGLVLVDSGHIDYADLDSARNGLLDRLSGRWPALADVRVLLLLATRPPHVDQNREHLPRFQSAVPHADVRWVDGAGHGVIADAGPRLGDEIAVWITEEVAAGRPARSG